MRMGAGPSPHDTGHPSRMSANLSGAVPDVIE
jgi:hypothetical protein